MEKINGIHVSYSYETVWISSDLAKGLIVWNIIHKNIKINQFGVKEVLVHILNYIYQVENYVEVNNKPRLW